MYEEYGIVVIKDTISLILLTKDKTKFLLTEVKYAKFVNIKTQQLITNSSEYFVFVINV